MEELRTDTADDSVTFAEPLLFVVAPAKDFGDCNGKIVLFGEITGDVVDEIVMVRLSAVTCEDVPTGTEIIIDERSDGSEDNERTAVGLFSCGGFGGTAVVIGSTRFFGTCRTEGTGSVATLSVFDESLVTTVAVDDDCVRRISTGMDGEAVFEAAVTVDDTVRVGEWRIERGLWISTNGVVLPDSFTTSR